MKRIANRKWWLFLILVLSVIIIWWGKTNIYSEAACPKLQNLVLYIVTGVGAVVTLIFAIFTKNNSPAAIFISLLFFFFGAFFISSIGGGYLSKLPQMQAVYCAPTSCEKANLARSLRETGKLNGAVDISQACLDDFSGECRKECAIELSLALFEIAGKNIDTLPEEWNNEKISNCNSIRQSLLEAQTLTEKYGGETHKSLIKERLKRYQVLCGSPPVTPTPTITPSPTPTPTPNVKLEILRAQRSKNQLLIDVRVLEEGQYRHNLEKKDFDVKISGSNQDFGFIIRDMDDPICMITVVDNSGSIYPGLPQIRDAIEKLNDLRKPNDQLALVLFSGRDQVKVEKHPSSGPLNPKAITGSGKLTALWDGALKGLDISKSCSSEAHPYLVLLTDGKDNDSSHLEGDNTDKAIEISNLGAQKGVDICTVGIESSQALDSKSLRLAVQGCDYYPAENFDALATTFQTLFGYVRDFYRITIPIDVVEKNNNIVFIKALDYGEVNVEFDE